MGRELADTTLEAIDDEADVLARHHLDDLLDDVVAVLVLDNPQHVGLQLLDHLSLLLDEDVFQCLEAWSAKCKAKDMRRNGARPSLAARAKPKQTKRYLLNNAAGVHLHREVDDLALHDPGQNLLLDLVAVLEELLDDVVAKHVFHELDGIGLDLPEHLIFLVAVGRFKLLLDEAGAVLVTAEFDNMIVYVLRGKRVKSQQSYTVAPPFFFCP